MTISTTTSRITYSGNGVTNEFAFPYYFFESGDLIVILTDSDGVSTVQTITSNYTVTGAGNDSGGTVTMLTPPAAGESLLIYRSLSLTQETDYITGDPFPAETHERALDRLTMIAQQLQEELNRSAKLPVTSVVDADALVEDLTRLADSADNIDTVAGISANVTSVAGNATNINTVAGISGNVTTVAGIASDVTTVAANVADVTNFADVYQGPKTSDPATRNDSSALQAGDLYFNTVSERMRVYSGSVWADTSPTATSITSTQISDSTTTGRAVLTAADAAAARTAITAQETLVSGTNIKTVNGQPLLGSGNLQAGGIALGTAVASTSGTAIDFTGIPAGVRRITVMFRGVSTAGTSPPQIQLGSGGVQASGYSGTSSAIAASTAAGVNVNTSGFVIGLNTSNWTAAATVSGSINLINISGNSWVAQGFVSNSAAPNSFFTSGAVTLSGVLDQIRITTVNGTDTFDAGTINISWEF